MLDQLVNVVLTAEQTALLARMKRAPIVFSGFETDEQRLAMLQLYVARLVDQSKNSADTGAIAWKITQRGRVAARVR